MKPPDAFGTALEEARRKLDDKRREREEAQATVERLDQEMIQLRRIIVGLSAFRGEEPALEEMGITDACRKVMASAKKHLTLAQIKDGLAYLGFDLTTQKNPDASVMAVLSRLADKKEIRKMELRQTDGKTITVYLGPNART